MSRYHGPQAEGARRKVREQKRIEATPPDRRRQARLAAAKEGN